MDANPGWQNFLSYIFHLWETLVIQFHTIPNVQKIEWNLYDNHFSISGNCKIRSFLYMKNLWLKVCHLWKLYDKLFFKMNWGKNYVKAHPIKRATSEQRRKLEKNCSTLEVWKTSHLLREQQVPKTNPMETSTWARGSNKKQTCTWVGRPKTQKLTKKMIQPFQWSAPNCHLTPVLWYASSCRKYNHSKLTPEKTFWSCKKSKSLKRWKNPSLGKKIQSIKDLKYFAPTAIDHKRKRQASGQN